MPDSCVVGQWASATYRNHRVKCTTRLQGGKMGTRILPLPKHGEVGRASSRWGEHVRRPEGPHSQRQANLLRFPWAKGKQKPIPKHVTSGMRTHSSQTTGSFFHSFIGSNTWVRERTTRILGSNLRPNVIDSGGRTCSGVRFNLSRKKKRSEVEQRR